MSATRVRWTAAIWIVFVHTATAADELASACAGSDRAVELFNAGEQDAAYPLLAELSAQGCGQGIVYLYQGVYERGQGQRTRAVETFRRGLAYDASNVPLLLQLAVTYSWIDRLPEALATYQAVRRLDTANTAARLGEARVLGWMGQRDDAAAGFEAVLEEQPDNTEALSGLAAVHLAALRLDSARDYYRRVLSLAPTNGEALEGLRRADAIKRLEVSTGVASELAPSSSFRLGITAAYQATPQLRMTAGYNTTVHDPILEQVDSSLRGRSIASRVNAGLGWRFGRRSAVSVAYQAANAAGDTLRATSLETTRKLNDELALLGGVRFGASTSGGSLFVGSTGVTFAPSAGTTLAVQGFYVASKTGRSTAVAASLRLADAHGCGTDATLGVSFDNDVALTLSAATAFRLAPDASVRIEGTLYRGQYSTLRMALTLRTQF